MWRAAQVRDDGSDLIVDEDVSRGIEAARQGFDRTVLETAIARLPKAAMEYLLAMADDALASSTGEIAKRLGVPAASLSSARKLLVSRQVIEPTARGYVRFSIPFMREYLINNRVDLLARYGIECSPEVSS